MLKQNYKEMQVSAVSSYYKSSHKEDCALYSLCWIECFTTRMFTCMQLTCSCFCHRILIKPCINNDTIVFIYTCICWTETFTIFFHKSSKHSFLDLPFCTLISFSVRDIISCCACWRAFSSFFFPLAREINGYSVTKDIMFSYLHV